MIHGFFYADTHFTVAESDGNLFGGFLEHIGRAVYTGIYEPEHPTADSDGFRRDVAELVRMLDMPLTRYPGGNFVSAFNWKDSIGPKENRPVRLDTVWSAAEPNHVGLDEFIKWCRLVNSEPIYVVNMGTGTVQSAREVVEYCNHPSGSYWSDLRRKNGSEEPHKIRYWCLGNEMSSPIQPGYLTAEGYAEKARAAARLMRAIDPSIKLIACGSSCRTSPDFGEWDYKVVKELFWDIDYLAVHIYFRNSNNNYLEFLAAPEMMDKLITDTAACCDAVSARHQSHKKIMLAIDEWNVCNHDFFGNDDPATRWQVARNLWEEKYTLADALAVAGGMMSLIDHSDRVKIACIAQTVNVLAPIMTEPGGKIWKQTIFNPLALLSRWGRGTVLKITGTGPEYSCGKLTVPYLRCTAVWQKESQMLNLFVLNRSLKEDAEFSFEFSGAVFAGLENAQTLHGKDPAETNDSVCERVAMQSLNLNEIHLGKHQITAKLPPFSWSILQINLVR